MTNDETTTTITETSSDGTESVYEIAGSKGNETFTLETDDASVFEEVIEALSDGNLDDAEHAAVQEHDVVDTNDAAGDLISDNPASVEASLDPITSFENTSAAGEAFYSDAYIDSHATGTTLETGSADISNSASTDGGNLEAHTQAAEDAQQAADNFVAQGDYAAAEQARETAENEAWEAGDNSMLHGSNSTELDNASTEQGNADYYEQQEAYHAQQGDYEAARDDAGNAGYATSDADFNAGGSDHAGQSGAEYQQMDSAAWEQSTADNNAQSAEAYVAQGDFNNAAVYADAAADHQAAADYHGDLGEHGGDMGVYDASSHVDTGGGYESPAVDYSTVDHSTVDHSTDYSSE